MNIEDVILTRRSSRSFNEKIVEEEKIVKLIEAAKQAPTGGNCQSTHLLVIEDKDVLEDLIHLVQQEFALMDYDENTYKSLIHSINASKKGNYVFNYHAPVLIVVANKKNYPNAIADSACALENMMIMANALDLGSCWINQLHWLDEHKALNDYLRGIGLQTDETVCGALAVGYCDHLKQDLMNKDKVTITRI